MPAQKNSDSVASYERACVALASDPYDRQAQYHAVLALARMGSTQFAQDEYNRFGLSKVRGHEEIMALGGRVSKDLYLASNGAVAQQHALASAQKYDAAFQETQGYYSAVNAATMYLFAGVDRSDIHARANQILSRLPATENLTPAEYYFIEATRSECLLLLGERKKASQALKKAIRFDPLNYTAHASTLKQFRQIAAYQSDDDAWLDAFTPPRPAHFAGHIWHSDTKADPLSSAILEDIQAHDIGYGYGALAAGADIEIAEQLLEGGAELHIILPCPPEDFVKLSVHPYGLSWPSRFEACLAAAHSISYLSHVGETDARTARHLASLIAMGKSILKAREFQVRPCQLLVQKQQDKNTLTSDLATLWKRARLDQIIVPLSGKLRPEHTISNGGQTPTPTSDLVPEVNIFSTVQKAPKKLSGIDQAMSAAKALQRPGETILMTYALEFEVLRVPDLTGLPEGLFISEAIAATLALNPEKLSQLTFAGILKISQTLTVRVFRTQ